MPGLQFGIPLWGVSTYGRCPLAEVRLYYNGKAPIIIHNKEGTI